MSSLFELRLGLSKGGRFMKVVVIGACGHIGSYLVPKLVKGGFKVVAISRGKSKPYINDPAWKMVEQVVLDRNKDEDFAYKVAKMNADIVVDLINFNIEDTKKMVTALKEIKISHYLYCSSIWLMVEQNFYQLIQIV